MEPETTSQQRRAGHFWPTGHLRASVSVLLFTLICIPPITSAAQSASAQAPWLTTAPLVQLDTSAKYYTSMIDGLMFNFKKAVVKSSELDYSLANATKSMVRPISVASSSMGAGEKQRVSIQDIQIEGLNHPKVSTAYINTKNLKLHVVFTYKTIRVLGKCVSSSGSSLQKRQLVASGTGSAGNKVLLEATHWNASWAANVMHMIGREHFDMTRVFTNHSQQRLSLNLKECPQSLHEELKLALMDRVKAMIDNRLVEIMERIMMKTDTNGSGSNSTSSGSDEAPFDAPEPKEREKRSSAKKRTTKTGSKSSRTEGDTSPRKENPIVTPPMKSKSRLELRPHANGKSRRQVSMTKDGKRILSRRKRQTPCQQGEELDDYVDQLFRFGQRIVRAMEPVTLPNATIELPDYNLKIFLYDGKGTRAYKFRRTKPAWVFCSNETISLGITIEVEELRVAYKYRVISGSRLVFDGDLEARLSPKVQAQFSQAVQEEDSEEPVQQRIDRIRVFRLGRVSVVIRGLGNLTQSLSMIINSYLNDNQEELQPTFRMVEGDAVRLLNRMLANVNVPLLSVV